MNPRSHIFISYARSDGEAFAREIHRRLESEQNLTCWRDRLDLEGGEGFWTQLESGIESARWVLIVLTPGALRSPWTAKEWREARKRGVPICPVWPLSAQELGAQLEGSQLPAGMQRSHVYTPFPAGDQTTARANEEWQNLVQTLRAEREIVRAPFMAPHLPRDYIDRADAVTAAVNSLLASGQSPYGRCTVLRGAAGMGKTTLAKALTHRDEVVDAFYDGVLWVTVGIHPRLTEIIADLCVALGHTDVRFSDLAAAEGYLRGRLENRRCLLVVDDVWKPSDLQPFISLGASVSVLATTRVTEVALAAEERARIKIDAMTDEEATRVVAAAFPGGLDTRTQTRCRELARVLGRWPLLLRLAAGQIRVQLEYGEVVEGALDSIAESLRVGGITALDGEAFEGSSDDVLNRETAFATSIGASLQLLKEAERTAFLDLGVFPEDVQVPLATAAQIWGVPDAKGLALRIANLSLIDLKLGARPALGLHDQVREYVASRLKADGRWAQVHRRLVDTWKDPAQLPDDYAWRWVCHHLKEAGEKGRLLELLFDYEAVTRRLETASVGIGRLVADYALISDEEDGAHIRRLLARAGHILVEHPRLLAQQLVGRIDRDSPRCRHLRDTARDQAPRYLLLPRTPSLAWPERLPIEQLVEHSAAVVELALTDDGRLVTGGNDGQVYCVRLEEGTQPLLLGQHEGGVTSLELTADGRVVMGSSDGNVSCTSLDGGEPELLVRHEGGVSALALTTDGRVVTGGQDGRVYCTSLGGGDPALLVRHEDEGVAAIALSDGRVVTAGWDGRVYCTPLEGGEPVLLAKHDRPVEAIALFEGGAVSFGYDGRVYCTPLDGGEPVLLAQHERGLTGTKALVLTGDGRVVTGGQKGEVYCARLNGGEPVLLARHEGAVDALVLTTDGRVVTGGRDGRLYCAALDGGGALLIARFRLFRGIRAIAIAGDNGLVVGCVDGQVYWVRLDGGAEPQLLVQHAGGLGALRLGSNGRIVTGGMDGRVFAGRLEGEPRAFTRQRHEEQVSALALSTDGRAVTGGHDGRVYCTSLGGGDPALIVRHDAGVAALALSDGRVVTGGYDGRVYCTPLDGGEPVLLARHEAGVLTMSVGEGCVVTGGWDGRVYCARLDSREPPVLLARHDGWISALLLTGDGRAISGGGGGPVYCTPLEGGKPVALASHDYGVGALALCDGLAVTGGYDGRVYCARLDGGEPPRLLVEHEQNVPRVAFATKTLVLTSGNDGRVYCVSLGNGEPVLLVRHEDSNWNLVATADGRVVTGGRDGRVYCVHLDGRDPLLLVRHEKEVEELVLVGDGQVVTGGSDGRVYCARLDGGEPRLLAQHDRGVSALVLAGEGRVVSAGRDGTLFLSDLAARTSHRVFAADSGLAMLAYDSSLSTLVATDEGGGVHILPIA